MYTKKGKGSATSANGNFGLLLGHTLEYHIIVSYYIKTDKIVS